MSNPDLYIFESPESESVVICERHAEGELPFASVFPGVPMRAPARADVRALARARAERIIEALAWDDLDLPTSGKSLAEMVHDATGFPEHWKTDHDDALAMPPRTIEDIELAKIEAGEPGDRLFSIRDIYREGCVRGKDWIRERMTDLLWSLDAAILVRLTRWPFREE